MIEDSGKYGTPNSITAHNTFAIPVLTPTFGILESTKKEEVEQIDGKTRKLLCISGNFHRNSSPDRLYTLFFMSTSNSGLRVAGA